MLQFTVRFSSFQVCYAHEYFRLVKSEKQKVESLKLQVIDYMILRRV